MTRALQDKAREHMGRNEWVEAVEYLKQAQETEPRNVYVLDNLAFCQSRLGNHKEAITIYQQLCEEQPDTARWPYMLGYQYYDQKDFETAVRHFDEALQIAPDYIVASCRKGYALSTMGYAQRGNALTAFEKCRSAYHALPDGEEKQREAKHYADACYQQGKLFLEAGNLSKAVDRLREAVSLKPDDPYVHYSLGKAYVEQGDFSKAIPVLEKARQLTSKPEHYILDRLAQAYSGAGRIQEARQIYEKLPVSMTRQWAYIARNMGEMYIQLEEWDRALDVLQQATHRDQHNHNGFYFLGQVYEAKEQWQQAAEAYRTASHLRQRHQSKPFPEAEDALKAVLAKHPDAKQMPAKKPSPKPSSGRKTARVKTFNSRGFGFLSADDGDLFFHISQVKDREEVEAGECLEYEIGTGRDGRPAAINLKVVE